MNKIIVGDCREIMRGLIADGVKVQMCVTSPPYWGLRDYGVAGQLGLEPTIEEYVANMVGVFRLVRELLVDDGTLWLNLGDSYAGSGRGGNPTEASSTLEGGQETQRASMVKRRGSRLPAGLHETQRLSGAIGRAWVPPPSGLKQKDLCMIPARVALALQADGWWLRQDIIWAKKNCMPESVQDRCTKSHEYIFMLAKSERYYFDADAIAEPQEEHERTRRLAEQARGLDTRYEIKRDDAHGQHPPGESGCAKSVRARHTLAVKGTRNKRSVWFVGTQPYPEAHFATFPPKLIEPCILAGSRPGDVVFDPFMGSGTTGAVAQRFGRQWLGIELNAEYAKLAEARTSGTIGMQLMPA